ncbi:hypothetical protein FE784_26420 [Paenibacillus hemerocallicola]|jgi:hypothetical protein|uniref:Uncharacterized protein n=1 Tax=Paenibacillus hemerocallicola TaxID=1172614 RepID=A0A5C4T2D5_9BACL|nr:hypothetical protein [Paenibacillus hemerocallicola]TNJ63204.1 hypothetical protein FE784_26420 [Paenibacillus hemerocallicola]
MFPPWLIQAMRRRFDEVAARTAQASNIEQAYTQFDSVLQSFMDAMDDKLRNRFMVLEEKWNYVNSLEQEWLYMQGVKDGACLLSALQDSSRHSEP